MLPNHRLLKIINNDISSDYRQHGGLRDNFLLFLLQLEWFGLFSGIKRRHFHYIYQGCFFKIPPKMWHFAIKMNIAWNMLICTSNLDWPKQRKRLFVTPIGNSLRTKICANPLSFKKCLELQLFAKLKVAEGFGSFFSKVNHPDLCRCSIFPDEAVPEGLFCSNFMIFHEFYNFP